MPYVSMTSRAPASFMRQFSEESGRLVYRRNGSGPAYAITENQQAEWLDRYVSRSRLHRGLLLVVTLALFGLLAVVLETTGYEPPTAVMAIGSIAAVAILVGTFTWFELRNLHTPARELAGAVPLSDVLDKRDVVRRQLRDIPWINFAIAPAMGLFVVWTFRDDIDPLHGAGLLIWLVPLALATLAGVQAWRKYRADAA
jgi:hypothetical protein